MSDTANYYTAPLSILRSGKTELEALTNALDVGIVNAGVGFTAAKDEEEVEEAMEAAREKAEEKGYPSKMPARDILYDASGTPLHRHDAVEIWDKALLGWKILGITGGNRTADAQAWLRLHRQGEVFFRIKSEFMWGAIYTERRDAGGDDTVERPLSWREFRILAAILSERTNKYGFAFIGWKTIQARACGYHSRKLFEANKEALPSHCEPLTSSKIYATCDKLEALGFYARTQYSKGPRGGFMAYSFKLERKALIQAVKNWAAANASFKTKVDSFRDSDRESFAK